MTNALVANLTARVTNIIKTPKTEWDKIEGEAATIPDLYKYYACILAVIPAVATFLKSAVIGITIPITGATFRVPVGHALGAAAAGYVLTMLGIAALAFIVDFLAPKFGGQSKQINAFKLSAYSMTAAWLAGAFVLIPYLGSLLALTALYSLYLFYLGVPKLMKTPASQAGIFTVVALVINVAVMVIASFIMPRG